MIGAVLGIDPHVRPQHRPDSQPNQFGPGMLCRLHPGPRQECGLSCRTPSREARTPANRHHHRCETPPFARSDVSRRLQALLALYAHGDELTPAERQAALLSFPVQAAQL
jgi:hypothetical protein